MKRCLLAILIAAKAFAAAPLMISFDGKGVAMAWDIGVVQSWNAHLHRERISETYMVGTSSGSILTAFFACHGFGADAMNRILEAARVLPKDVLDEAQDKRMVQLFLGVPPEITLTAVNPVLDLVTENSTCLPTTPILIAAANLDVLDGRLAQSPFVGRPGRTFDRATYVASENGKARGKACTYFVNEAMAKILHEVPAKERLCDLRYVRSGADLRMAVVASISEPTYYPTVVDPDPSQIESVFPVTKRTYQGGFAMISAVQDLKRARPESWVIGTGHPSYNRVENRIILNWFGLPMNETLLEQRWWFDLQIPMTADDMAWLHRKEVTPPEQIARGFAAAEKCFNGDRCLPTVTWRPHFDTDLTGRKLDDKRARGIAALAN